MNKNNDSQAVLAQLSKAPISGRVKTRMQPALSVAQSEHLHRWLTEQNIKKLSTSPNWVHHLWVDEAHSFFSELQKKYPVEVSHQVSGDLGRRLNAISEAYQNQALILIGSDCPFITNNVLVSVLECLKAPNVDAVLIPAHDGGYVCLAVKRHHSELFDDIDWGTSKVAEQTLERAKGKGINMKVFAKMSDIDRPIDLQLLNEFGLIFDKGVDGT